MCGEVLFAQTLGQMPRSTLGKPARFDKHQSRAVFADELGQALIDLGPHLTRHHRLER